MIDVKEITDLQKVAVTRWHLSGVENPYQDFLAIVCQEHERNYRLWHREDVARSADVADAELAQVKRDIDKLNQQRNDLIEQLDDFLIEQLRIAGVQPWPEAHLNSETPGSAIDRLSILALRIYHMEEQAARTDADEQHRAGAAAKLEILHQQHADLSRSLSELLEDIFAGRKRLKVYRQFKMYNDPTMNPCLYRTGKRSAA
ncbi:MAG: hypothetical protein A2V70_01065 [Planctomycetes bacterium RBG_13_63_9]|nr:MAG: hypothetical protein A2V70_01065 [Planctomycetes bacterium RBG_13_63_9]